MEAESIYRQILPLDKMFLGKEHPKRLITIGSMTTALADQQKYEEAVRLYRDTLILQYFILGKEHSKRLTSIITFACTLADQPKYEEAECLHRETLRLREVILGKGHPDTVATREELALVLSDQGKYEQASLVAAVTVTEQGEETTAAHLVTDPASLAIQKVRLLNKGKGHEAGEDDTADGGGEGDRRENGGRRSRIPRLAKTVHSTLSASADPGHPVQSSPQSNSSK